MTKHRWKSFSNHIDPEKEEQLKWVKIEIENQVKRILKLTKGINHGNKERNLRKKSEVIQLIEDFQKQYESLYSLYEDLREEVKKNVGAGVDDSSSNSDAESYHSPGESNARTNKMSSGNLKDSDSDNQDPETSDLEDTILKDKLTSSSEVKRTMNLDSPSAFSKPPEYEEILKDLRIQREESENASQKLDQIKDLEGQVASLKLEISTLCTQKRQLQEQVECKSDEALQMKEKISRLEAQILEIEATSKENECQFYSLRKQSEDNERHYLSRISDLVAQANGMQLELNNLKHQKGELEGRLSRETEQSSQVKGLMEQVNSLQHELVTANSQKAELKLEVKKKSEETSECLLQIEVLRNELTLKEQHPAEEKEGLKVQLNDLESEIHSLSSKKSDLEEQLKKMNREASVENEKLHGKISELQTALSEREDELSTEQKKFTACQNIMSMKTKSLAEEVKNLKSKLETLQNERNRLQEELEALQNDKKRLQMEFEKEREESSLSKSQVEKISRSNFQLVERKVEEMAEEFRKQFEDKYRILSRRIRVAEQLQVENKEWYRKTKETYEQENHDLKERVDTTEIGLKNVKDMTLTANDVLTSLDSVALKFEECTANFLNRISKASCELKFAKHWAMRKNKAVLHVKDDLDCLLAQLDDKEAEILVFREKVWKSENKVRELEKMIKEKEDGMLGLKEEKREAIRQLCVWIDYHRGRSDYYKKMLSDMNPGRRRAS
ncbi:hypothetical protein Pfo_025306 [Paulownia fortunei]|nr:hypothetical protein Pfo_025306 [Paulownia fortunei]